MSQSDLVIGPPGPVMPDSAAVLEAVQGDWRAALGDNLNVNPATPQGQLMASQAAAIQDKNAQLLYLASQFNPEQAEGIYQDALAKVYFLERNPARSTVVAIACMGLPGTVIRGSDSSDDPYQVSIGGERFVCTRTDAIPQGGTVTLPFAAVNAGPIEVPAGAAVTIVQVVEGWDDASAPQGGVTGQDVESRAAFERRRYQSVARNARSVAGAVYARVAELSGVLDCIVRQNRGDSPLVIDGVTLGPHSIYVGVLGGDDTAIAQAIYDSLSAGCDYNGDTSVVITDAVTGAKETVTFTRLVDLAVGVRVTVRKNALLPSDVVKRVQDAILADFYGEYVSACDQQSLRVRAGEDLYASRFYPVILAQGVTQLVSIEVAAPVGAGQTPAWGDYVHIRIDQAPQLARDNIAITIIEQDASRAVPGGPHA